MRLHEGADFDWIPIEKVFEYKLTEKTKKDLKKFFGDQGLMQLTSDGVGQ
jgi:hypothetical protein